MAFNIRTFLGLDKKSGSFDYLGYLRSAMAQRPGSVPPGDYATHAAQGYGMNPTVYSCVSTRAENLSKVQFVLKQRRGKEEKELEDHELLEVLRAPNDEQSGSDFLEYVEGSLCLSGNAYIRPLHRLSDQQRRQPPIGLLPLQTNLVEPEIRRGPSGIMEKIYRYTSSEGTQTTYSADEIIHIKLYNPLSTLVGMGPITAARYQYSQNNQGNAWNHGLLLNSAKASGVLETPNPITENQRDQLKKIIDEMVGPERAGRPPIFPNGLKWQNISMSPVDMDWLNGMKFTALQICMVYKVPGQIVGIPDSQTYANMEQAERSLWTNAVMPDVGRIVNTLNKRLLKKYYPADNLALDVDRDAIQELREAQNDLYTRMSAASWLKVNEKRQACGFDLLPPDVGDVVLVPAGMIPLELAIEEPAPLPEDDDDGDGADTPFGSGGY